MNNNLRIILAQQRKTLRDVHEATGISLPTLTSIYYERAKKPQLETLVKIAKYLNVTLNDIYPIND